jgi:threonine/homoserine/homoserine lactone efflux protein
MDSLVVSVLSIAGAIALGAMSPGPSFIMVARTALAVSRMDGVAAALGMGAGGVLFAAAALLGLHVILNSIPWLYLMIKVLGGAYLVYLGCRIWLGATQPVTLGRTRDEKRPDTFRRSFLLGLVTQVSNPKTAIVYASIFISLLPREVPASVMFIVPLAIFFIETGWYCVVALSLSAPAPRAAYLRSKTWMDRITGGVMAALGMKLIVGARAA